MRLPAGTLLKAALLGAVTALSLLRPERAGATLLGASVHGRYLYPTTSDVFLDEGTQTITPTTVFDFTAETRSAGVTVTFSDAQVTVTTSTTGELRYGPVRRD